jgi:hypothetical protein
MTKSTPKQLDAKRAKLDAKRLTTRDLGRVAGARFMAIFHAW